MPEKNNNTLSQALGKGMDVTLRDKTYKVYPLTVGDIADLESHIRSKKITDFINAVKETDMDSAERLTVITTLASEPVSMEQGNEVDNVRFLFWCAIRKDQPEMKLEDMNNLVGVDNVEDMNAILEGLSVGGEKDKNENPTKLAVEDTASTSS